MGLVADAVMADFEGGRYEDHAVNQFLNKADSFIIAHAMELNAKVVTFEKSDNSPGNVKIPDIARKFNVVCCNIYEMMNDFDPKFDLVRQ